MRKINILGTIEARMGSSRLPGKVLKSVYKDLNLLELVFKRFSLCDEVDQVCVATSTSPLDNQIAEFCSQKNIPFFRGSEDDVLSRVVAAANPFSPDAVVQMGGDSGFLDFNLIDRLVRVYKKGNYDYVCNDLIREYPIGIYGHVVSFSALKRINNLSFLTQQEREDVVRHFWNDSANFKILNVRAPQSYQLPNLRLTIDYPEDLELLQNVIADLKKWDFSFQDIIQLYVDKPELFKKVEILIQKSMPEASRIMFETCELLE